MINLRSSWAILVLTVAPWASGFGAPIEVRFYPGNALRYYEVEPRRAWNSALLHNVAVLNRSDEEIALDHVEIDLLTGGNSMQTQHLPKAELERAAQKGVSLQKSGLLQKLAFQFRPDILLGPGMKLSEGVSLAPRTAVQITYRYFVFSGRADQVRVRVFGQTTSGGRVEGEATLPLVAYKSEVKYSFPLAGRFFVGTGQALHQPHRWVVAEEFALDLVKLGDGGSTHRGDGSRRAEYFAYGEKVLAVADGKVVAVQNGVAESDAGLRRPGEAAETYLQRVLATQDELIRKGPLAAAGNYVVIQHAPKEFSFSAHLIPGSIPVARGDAVKRGQVIGQLGHSGNSTEPHLHFHLVDGPDPIMSAGLPLSFENVELPLADGPRAIQSGDIVEAR